MFAPRPPVPRRRARRGAAAFETLLVLPLFLALLLGMVGIADLLITEQLLAEASCRGARAAALGGSPEQVRECVRAVLGDDRGRRAKIHVGAADGEPGPVPPGGLIEVRVELEARDATATRLAPVRGDEPLVGRTVMQRE
jgi:TadE-like protein